jgi:hypothetical protein
MVKSAMGAVIMSLDGKIKLKGLSKFKLLENRKCTMTNVHNCC